ncbi:hypothetical protein HK099_005045 [Clydaea vesicula]|uniref:Uncharacterized protein n=1 Tax=Clydaea vesicula TaxID=447962 RepID=A0AAD5UAH0_9FUNG|nr:hypothetical protein HK099_005045 [Clydaea vesicula]
MIYSVTNDANSIGLTMEMTSRLNSSDEAWSNDPFSVKSTTGGIPFTGTSIQTVNTILIILITLLLPAIHKFVRASLLSRGYITTSILSESNTDDAVRILRKTNCNRNSKIFSLTMIVTLAITALLSSSVPYSTKTMIDVKLADDIFLALNRPNHTIFLKEGNQDFVEAKIVPGEVEQLGGNHFRMNTTMGEMDFSAPSHIYQHKDWNYDSINFTEKLITNNVTHYLSRTDTDSRNDAIPDTNSDGWFKPRIGSATWTSFSSLCEGKHGENTQYLYDSLADTYTGYTHCFEKYPSIISPLFSMKYITFREKYVEGDYTDLNLLNEENYLRHAQRCHGDHFNLSQVSMDDSQVYIHYSVNVAFSDIAKITELTSRDEGIQCLTTEIHYEIRGGKVLEFLRGIEPLRNFVSFETLRNTNSWAIMEILQSMNGSDRALEVIWNGSNDKARLEHFIGMISTT